MLPLSCTDPYTALGSWLGDAIASEPRVPDAMQVATVGPDGRPSLRTVLLKHWGPDGLIFYTHIGSRKAQQLDTNPHCAILLHWKSLERQVIAEGQAQRIAESMVDAYWATRPRGSQLGAWASKQSAPLASPRDLTSRVESVRATYIGEPVPRPPTWGGFRVVPTRFEFWQGRPDRLHERDLFELQPDQRWARSLLQP